MAEERNRGKGLSDAQVKMILRQYRMIGQGTQTNWAELGRRCHVHGGTAKRYVENHLVKENQK